MLYSWLPLLLIVISIGQNPTSGTLSVERRKELYALCSKYGKLQRVPISQTINQPLRKML
jgi:hypothetical protein